MVKYSVRCRLLFCHGRNPTDPFTILELQNPSHHVPDLPKIDFEAHSGMKQMYYYW